MNRSIRFEVQIVKGVSTQWRYYTHESPTPFLVINEP